MAKAKHNPSASSPAPTDDPRTIAASYVQSAMKELLIYSAALKSSDCEVARAVGERLGIGYLHNDLDLARECLVGATDETAGAS